MHGCVNTAQDGARPSLGALFEERQSDPPMQLLAKTCQAMRADPDYYRDAADLAGGLSLTLAAPALLEDDAVERALARIDRHLELDARAAEQARSGSPRTAELAGLPSPLREAALRALQARGWSFGGFGVRRLPLMADGGATAELIRVEPGFGAAEHDHAGEEFTLVLTGAYDDGHALYQPGDVSRAAPDFKHAPRAEPGEVCYLLLVSYGPPKFTGRIGVLQKLTGFPWAPRPPGSGKPKRAQL